jgi:hypothetical protein
VQHGPLSAIAANPSADVQARGSQNAGSGLDKVSVKTDDTSNSLDMSKETCSLVHATEEGPKCPSQAIHVVEEAYSSWMYPSTWFWNSGTASKKSEPDIFSVVAAARLLLWVFPKSSFVWSTWTQGTLEHKVDICLLDTEPSEQAQSTICGTHNEQRLPDLSPSVIEEVPTPRSIRTEESWSDFTEAANVQVAGEDAAEPVCAGSADGPSPSTLQRMMQSWRWRSNANEVQSLPVEEYEEDICSSPSAFHEADGSADQSGLQTEVVQSHFAQDVQGDGMQERPDDDGDDPSSSQQSRWWSRRSERRSGWGWRSYSSLEQDCPQAHPSSASLCSLASEDLHTPMDIPTNQEPWRPSIEDTGPLPESGDHVPSFSSMDTDSSRRTWGYPSSWGWRSRPHTEIDQEHTHQEIAASSWNTVTNEDSVPERATSLQSCGAVESVASIVSGAQSAISDDGEIDGSVHPSRMRADSAPPGFLTKMTAGLRGRQSGQWTWSNPRQKRSLTGEQRRSHSEGALTPKSKKDSGSAARESSWSARVRGSSDPPQKKFDDAASEAIKPIKDDAKVNSWSNPVSWMRTSVHYASWLYKDANFLLDSMAPKPVERQLPLAEFELADLLQAFAKLADLGAIASDMTPFFWIFIVAFVLVISSILFAIIDLWISALTSYLGWFAYVMLLIAVSFSWPAFFHYLVRTIVRGYYVKNFHQCTVQIHGIPPACATQEYLEKFCRERALPVRAIYVSPPCNRDRSVSARQRVELMFGSVDDMKKAFTSQKLTADMKIGGYWVRVRPKAGTSSAGVEWLLVLMEYLSEESVPSRFWLRCTLSCLISMSLTRTFLQAAVEAASSMRSKLPAVVHFVGFLCAMVSLGFLFFYVGYHSYIDMAEAREDLRREQRQDRLFEPPPPPAHVGSIE